MPIIHQSLFNALLRPIFLLQGFVSYSEKGKKTSASVGGLGLWADGIVWDECSLDLCSCFSWVHPGSLIPRKFQLLLRVAGLPVALINLWRHDSDSCLKARELNRTLLLNGPNLHRWEALAWVTVHRSVGKRGQTISINKLYLKGSWTAYVFILFVFYFVLFSAVHL